MAILLKNKPIIDDYIAFNGNVRLAEWWAQYWEKVHTRYIDSVPKKMIKYLHEKNINSRVCPLLPSV